MHQQFIWPSRGSNVIGLWFVPLDPLPKHAPGRFAQHDRSGGASLVRPPRRGGQIHQRASRRSWRGVSM